MKRRHFIGAATASVLVPLAAGSRSVEAFAAISSHDDCAYFDERFETARRVAASWTRPRIEPSRFRATSPSDG